MHVFACTLWVAVLCLADIVAAIPQTKPTWRKRHIARAPAESFDSNITSRDAHTFEKRFDGARFTYYDAGLGACGKTNSGSDFIVAMNTAQFAGGAHCFQTITITIGNKVTQAQVTDMCPGCPFAGLDFSRGLFDFFASESAGVLTGSWVFGAGAVAASPSPTTTKAPAPTTTASPPHSSTTSQSSTSLATPSSTSSSSSTSVAPTPSAVAAPVGNIAQLFAAVIQIGGIAISGTSVTTSS